MNSSAPVSTSQIREDRDRPALGKTRRNGKVALGAFFGSTVLWSILAHVGLLGLATLIVAVRYGDIHKLLFDSKPAAQSREREVEYKVNAAAYSDMASASPVMTPKMTSLSESSVSLPEMPPLPFATADVPAFSPSLGGLPGLSAGEMSGGLGEPGGTDESGGGGGFFGLKDGGEAMVLMLDISDSMFLRGGEARFQLVRDEAARLIQGLNPVVRFGLIAWGGGVVRWKEKLAYAEKPNRDAAAKWVQGLQQGDALVKAGETGGTRHDLALKEAFALQPEVIYLISDGNARLGNKSMDPETIYALIRSLQSSLKKPVRLHVVYYVTSREKESEKKFLQDLAVRNQGQFRVVHGSD